MALVDEIVIHARAGHGGDGVVRWLHLKGREFSGPAGGNGGNGGSVYIRGVRDVALLARYRGEKSFKAGDGGIGESFSREGKGGNDIYIDIPIGSIVDNSETGERFEILLEGETQQVLKGGRGGAGNRVFKSSVNQTPIECTPGGKGEEADLSIELRLIADAGLIGLPNAGKTSLLNALTGALGKIGSYAFTTLDPNLGTIYGHVLADIPGLIEGAAAGKGLGFDFLRHIARTTVLVHCVSLESEDPIKDWETVREEISRFENGALANKAEIIVLTKSDTREEKEIQRISALFAKKSKDIAVVSVLDDAAVEHLRTYLSERLSKIKQSAK